jgi:hypothetical protein
VEALAQAPEVRLLRRLEVVYDMRYHPFDFGHSVEGPAKAFGVEDEDVYEFLEDGYVLTPLLASPYLSNLRVFKVGFSDDGSNNLEHSTMVQPFDDVTADRIEELLQKWPRLEELYLNDFVGHVGPLFLSPALGGLRVLQYYFGHAHSYPRSDFPIYPLTALADNESLRNLHTLRLHPGRDATLSIDGVRAIVTSPNLPALRHLQLHMTDYGDSGAQAIAESGILRRLQVLDIGYGNMTDAGARLLAEAPGIKNLEVLDVSRNSLSRRGIDALRQTGVNVVADRQHAWDERDYLYEVDAE